MDGASALNGPKLRPLPLLHKCWDRSSWEERHVVESTAVFATSSPFVF
jgi:hypothetical protein